MTEVLTKISPHIWVQQSQFANTNSGIFISAGEACLVDPGLLPVEIKKLANLLTDLNANAKALVLTHSHWDHLFGPEYFPDLPITAHADYHLQIHSSAKEKILSQVEKLNSHFQITRQEPFTIPQPEITFQDSLLLEIGELELQLLHTPGHSADHLSIYNPDSGELWAGDLLSDLEIPYIIHSLPAYQKTLELLSDLNLSCLVPGHGTPINDRGQIQGRLNQDRSYLNLLEKTVYSSLRQGLSLDEILNLEPGFTHPCLGDNLSAHQYNIESVYLEMGGEGDPRRIGWSQDFE